MARAGFSIRVDNLPRLQRKLSLAEHEVFPKASARAVNTTARTVRSEMVKAVAKRMGVKQKVVRDGTTLKRARSGGDPSAVITIRGKPLNLIRFRARQTKKGVSAAPWGKRQLFRGAFISALPGNPVMHRKRRGGTRPHRLPITALWGPGIAPTANDPQLVREREALVRRVLPERLEREIAFLLSKRR